MKKEKQKDKKNRYKTSSILLQGGKRLELYFLLQPFANV